MDGANLYSGAISIGVDPTLVRAQHMEAFLECIISPPHRQVAD